MGQASKMYSIDDFGRNQVDELHDIALNISEAMNGDNSVDVFRAAFRYGRNWRPKISLDIGDGKLFDSLDETMTLGHEFPNQYFLKRSVKLNNIGRQSVTLTPKIEPFVFGEPCQSNHARCVVINGPSTHFQDGELSWRFKSHRFSYSLFLDVQRILKDREYISDASIPTGVLSVFLEKTNLMDYRGIWRLLHQASKVLSFTSGGRVGIGHIEFDGEEGRHFWMLGFSRADRLPLEPNWFDIEMVKDFQNFASAYHSHLAAEPTELPLLSSSDFYRASNAIN
ncbi:hypothetical protein JMM59_19075, partial [Rhodovulum sulfidophilum]|nr:hypothetical protein [Rhodovulum sulfidophilum]